MKKRFMLLAVPLAFGTAMAFAAPDRGAEEFKGPHPGNNDDPSFMMPPPRPEPVYAVTEQTDSPNEAVKTIASQVPQISGGKYTVRVEIIPQPPHPAGDGEHQPRQDAK